jgi:hypothetical protein
MKIAFIHYHLKTGGVTTVLKQQVEAIKDDCEMLVITGTPPESPLSTETVCIEGLGYTNNRRVDPGPEAVAESIIKAIHAKFGGRCNLAHVHNPTLAKNKNFLKILTILQKKKINLFLQIHDFAEDGRPLSYTNEEYVADCHYGVINSRDYNLLLKAGLKSNGLHKISNTIKDFDFKPQGNKIRDQVLYPIRAIRRKNIGEAILLSLFFLNNETLIITLPPNSPADIVSYEGWKAFVKSHNLKVEFDAGLENDFLELVQTSRFLVTTSITEGFGFSFLEPWLAGKLVWGRKLPDICLDFEKNGIGLDHLYTGMFVPVKWIGKERLYAKWKSCVLKICELFGYKINSKDLEKAFLTITGNDNIDFSILDEAFQKEIILHALSDTKAVDALIQLNPYLSAPGKVEKSEELIRHNRTVVSRHYHPALYRQRLLEIYNQVANVAVCQSINKYALLSHFLNLKQFSLLKWNDYVE